MFTLFSLLLCFSFWATEAQQAFANATKTGRDSLPELPEGELCTPGTSYKKDCNTCRCGEDNKPLCTKMACLDNDSVAALLKIQLNHKFGNKKILRSNNSDGYPELVLKEECIPGKIYKRGCNKCFCNEHKKALCSLKGCAELKKDGKQNQLVLVPEDVRPAFTAAELDALVVLPHSAAPCSPGGSYRIDCNACLCKANGNLLCDKMICLIYDKFNKKEAAKHSGTPCDENFVSPKCVICKCVNGKRKCEAKEGCVSDTVPITSLTGSTHKLLHQKKIRLGLAMDPHEDNCIPDQAYKQSCNKCYCQKDGAMRCTQKKCLNYVEAVKLQRHKLFLAKHGE